MSSDGRCLTRGALITALQYSITALQHHSISALCDTWQLIQHAAPSCVAGNESHAGQVFCCVGALALAGALQHVDRDLLSWWCTLTAVLAILIGRVASAQCFSTPTMFA